MRSDEYRGPERRVRNESEIAFDKRLDDLESRMKHVEEVLVNDDNPDAGLVAVVGKIRHDLANNSMLTRSTNVKVLSMNEGIENVLAMMSTFTALNQLAHVGQLFVKRIAPLATSLAAIWGAMKIWGPK